MTRRTKIICTIGPASESERMLRDMAQAGMDVARLAMAHASVDEGLERLRRVREVARDLGRPIGVLVDLPGPKIRTGPFDHGGVAVRSGDRVDLVVGDGESTAHQVAIDHAALLDDVRPGDSLTFGDAGVTAVVTGTGEASLQAEVTSGGVLRGRPGVHIPADRLSLVTPTDEDLRILDAFVEAGVDMVALSFVRSGSDVRRLATEPHPRGPLIVAKIENRTAIENLDGIIEESGAIMVARGHLGAECSLAELPHLQKEIIRRCISGGLPVITATQMLESMVTAPLPTRAEASDVANAVFDGSSAVMLSAETAIGADPVRVVETMSGIAAEADARFDVEVWADRLESMHRAEDGTPAQAITNAMTAAAARASERLDLKAIIAISGSGFTVRSMARFRPRAAILGVTSNPVTLRQLTSSWGTTPLEFSNIGSYEERVTEAIELAVSHGYVGTGDLIGVLAGMETSAASTDVFRLVRVP